MSTELSWHIVNKEKEKLKEELLNRQFVGAMAISTWSRNALLTCDAFLTAVKAVRLIERDNPQLW